MTESLSREPSCTPIVRVGDWPIWTAHLAERREPVTRAAAAQLTLEVQRAELEEAVAPAAPSGDGDGDGDRDGDRGSAPIKNALKA